MGKVCFTGEKKKGELNEKMSEEESESCSEMTEAIPGGVQLKETVSDGSISTVVTELDSTRLSGVAGRSTVTEIKSDCYILTEIKSDCSILTEIKSYSSKSREDVTGSSILTDDLPGSEFRFDVMRLLSWFVDGGQVSSVLNPILHIPNPRYGIR